MREQFDRLTGVLSQEEELLSQLVDSAKRETQALIDGDSDAFQACVKEQERMLVGMHDLERHRADHAVELALTAGASENSSFLGICAALPNELAERGRGLHDRLRGLSLELSTANLENDVLVRQALRQTQHSISLLTGIAEQEARNGGSYAPAGQGRDTGAAAVLDKRA